MLAPDHFISNHLILFLEKLANQKTAIVKFLCTKNFIRTLLAVQLITLLRFENTFSPTVPSN